jgi:hypothetical protein
VTKPGGEKGSAARRRAKAGREAYSLYVERSDERANEADGPFSPPGALEAPFDRYVPPAALGSAASRASMTSAPSPVSK